jgi:hypothetical protein
MYLTVHPEYNEGQNNKLLVANKFLKIVAKFKYLVTAVKNSLKKNKRKLYMRNACYLSFQSFVFPFPL